MTRTWIAALLLAAAAAGPAAAEGPAPGPAVPRAVKPAKIPFRVVKLMPDAAQALVYDRTTSEHLLVQVGDDVGEYQVIDVDDEELVLWRDGREIVLTVDPTAPQEPAVLAHRPPRVVSAGAGVAPAPVAPTSPAPAVAAPAAAAPATALSPESVGPNQVLIDPYGAGVSAAGPLDPYAAPAVVAPLDPYAVGPVAPAAIAPVTVGAAPAPGTLTPAAAAPAPVDPNAPHSVLAPPDQRASLASAVVLDPYAEPKVVSAPAGAEPIKGVPAPLSEAARAAELRADVLTIQRSQLEAAVTSFDKLAKDHGFEKTARGVRLRQVAPDSYAYSLGLRSGDVITAIDGAPLRGLDDAAAAYVRLASATRLTFDVERGEVRGSLRFALR